METEPPRFLNGTSESEDCARELIEDFRNINPSPLLLHNCSTEIGFTRCASEETFVYIRLTLRPVENAKKTNNVIIQLAHNSFLNRRLPDRYGPQLLLVHGFRYHYYSQQRLDQ